MNLTLIDQKLFVVSETVGVAVYDFDFELHFACSHPYQVERDVPCVLRVGAIPDYQAELEAKASLGLRLVNTLEQHRLASELDRWYPHLEDLTPRSLVLDSLPDAATIEASFDWPVFIKGSRQTSKHNPDLSIVRSRDQYEQVVERYHSDAILHWQRPVIREFIHLAPARGHVPGKVACSIEYRSFWWNGECVGWGRYWYQIPAYDPEDAAKGLEVAREAALRLAVPFLVVDFAKTADGNWIVIECNDAQESGYVAIPPNVLWSRILDHIEDC